MAKKVEITWKLLTALCELYTQGATDINISNYTYTDYLLKKDNQRIDMERNKVMARSNYKTWYETAWLTRIHLYRQFLTKHSIIELAEDFTTTDIEAMTAIYEDRTFAKKLTRKVLVAQYFKHQDEKYVKKDSRKEKAIKQLLNLSFFPEEEKEQQFLMVLHAKNTPTAILLCENANKLIEPRLEYTEIWHAGGKNIAKLEFIPPTPLPIYYLCDWDQDGLSIYRSIKSKFSNFKEMRLVLPQDYKMIAKNITNIDHKSKWKTLNLDFFTAEAREIIDFLQKNNLWITEQAIRQFQNQLL